MSIRIGRWWMTVAWREWVWRHQRGIDGAIWSVGPIRVAHLSKDVFMSQTWRRNSTGE